MVTRWIFSLQSQAEGESARWEMLSWWLNYCPLRMRSKSTAACLSPGRSRCQQHPHAVYGAVQPSMQNGPREVAVRPSQTETLIRSQEGRSNREKNEPGGAHQPMPSKLRKSIAGTHLLYTIVQSCLSPLHFAARTMAPPRLHHKGWKVLVTPVAVTASKSMIDRSTSVFTVCLANLKGGIDKAERKGPLHH